MKKELAEASARLFLHTTVCESAMAEYFRRPHHRVTLKFGGGGGKPVSLTLDAGLYALLDGIACQEGLPLADLVRLIHRRRNQRHSLPEAACSFIAHYYYLKAHAPMQDALPVVFRTPPLRLKNRPFPLRKQLFDAWRELTGCWYSEVRDPMSGDRN